MNPSPTTHKVMLLVDADNVSADVMEQAVRGVIAEHGHLHVRRAYCTAEVALKHQQLFKRLSMRPMVNLAAGKNSTDIALAVDAMDLVMAERPQLVYLDARRLRPFHRPEAQGCRRGGIAGRRAAGPPGAQGRGQEDHAAAASELDTVRAADAVPAARAPARKTAARKTATTRGARTAAAAEAPAPSAAAQAVLDAAPALIGGAELALNDVVQALRAAKLLGKHASSLKFFERLQGEFVLLQHPDRVRWSGAAPT
ncbi:MAG: NYN domain-containing protein [Variovorax paradoxus]|uniref:NYN domain-containing protein n=1 Tax=Variovorax paradoxus TaxID=34073 RepID=A0A2W5QGC5_VARPD|nr:MAG: NYN domain-containing protein [Variovorax paradoxus]